MKALSLRQPWASLIACGAKPYETRSWPPPVELIGQPIAIHAAKKIDDSAAAFVEELMYGQRGFALADRLDASMKRTPDSLMGCFGQARMPIGCIACIVRLDAAFQLGERAEHTAVPAARVVARMTSRPMPDCFTSAMTTSATMSRSLGLAANRGEAVDAAGPGERAARHFRFAARVADGGGAMNLQAGGGEKKSRTFGRRTLLTLASGRHCDLRHPRPEDVDFDVIAEQLAKEARYNGATPGVFYSVAEHSVRGTAAILRETQDRTLAAYFLLHDGHEHTLKDDTTPKKAAIAEEAEAMFGVLAERIIAAFNAVTERHDVAIHSAAGLPWPPSDEMRAAIKRWDLVMFVTEWRDLMKGREHPDWSPYVGVAPLEFPITPWQWRLAAERFRGKCELLLPCFQRDPA